jgi:hypothetical protein
MDVLAWSGSAGHCVVKVPTIATASDTVITFLLDASPTQPAVGASGGRNGVWADYEFCIFGESTGASAVDHAGKVSFTVDGTAADITSVADTNKLMPGGKATRFSTGGSTAGGDSIKCTLSGDLRALTISFSAMLNATSTADNYAIGSAYNSASPGQRKTIAWRGTDSSGQDSMQCWDSTNSWFKPASVFIPTANVTRFRGTLTYSANASGTRRQLWNGPDGTVASAGYSSHPVGNAMVIGNGEPGSSEPGNFQTSFFYVRSGVLSDHWLRAEYKMMDDPASIYTIS